MTFPKRPVFSVFFILLLLSGCTSIKLQLENQENDERSWLFPGGDLQQTNRRQSGPKPPLHLIKTLKFNAAPVSDISAVHNTLFVGTKQGRIHAYDLEKIEKKGRIKLPDGVESAFGLHEEGLLILGLKLGKETLACYDTKRGEFLWKKRAGLLHGSPIVTGDAVYVVARFGHADRYDLKTGERTWSFPFKGQAHTIPSISEKSMIFGSDNGLIYAVSLETGDEIWQFPTNAAVFASPVINKEFVYIAGTDSTIHALSLDKGTEAWSLKIKGRVRETPALSENGMLILGAGDGLVYGINSANGEKMWTFQTKSAPSTSPLIVGNTAYFGSLEKNFYAIDIENGAYIWHSTLRGRVRTNPLLVGETLVVGSEDRFIYLFRQQEAPLQKGE